MPQVVVVVVAIGMISNVDSVPELGAEASKTSGPNWCKQPGTLEKGVTDLR